MVLLRKFTGNKKPFMSLSRSKLCSVLFIRLFVVKFHLNSWKSVFKFFVWNFFLTIRMMSCVCVLACAFVLFLGEYFDKAGFTWRTKIKGRILYKTVTRMKKIEFSEWETSYFQNEKLLCLLKAFPMGSIHLKEEKKCCQTSLSSLCMAIDMTNFWLFVILNLNLYSISTVLCSEYCFFAVHGLWW